MSVAETARLTVQMDLAGNLTQGLSAAQQAWA